MVLIERLEKRARELDDDVAKLVLLGDTNQQVVADRNLLFEAARWIRDNRYYYD
jgi:hypothetical protein